MGAIKNYESLTISEKNKEEHNANGNDEKQNNNKKEAARSLYSKLAAKCDNYRGLCGIILAALAGIFVTMRSVSVKIIEHLDPTEVFLIRSIIQLVFLIPTLFIMKADPRGPEGTRLLLFLQGLAGSVSALLQFIAFSRLPVGEAATIFFSSPVIVMILSHCFLKEACGVYQVILVFFFLIGGVLIALPPSVSGIFVSMGIMSDQGSALVANEPLDMIGLVSAIVGSVLNAVNVMWMRKLQEVHSVILLFSYTVTGLFASCLPSIFWIDFTRPSLVDFGYTVLVTIYGVASRILLIMALKMETAGLVAMVYSLAYEVLSYLLQIVWFHQLPQPLRLAGAGLIVISVMSLTGETYVKKMFNWACCCRQKEIYNGDFSSRQEKQQENETESCLAEK